MRRRCDDGIAGIHSNYDITEDFESRWQRMKKWFIGLVLLFIAVFIWVLLWMLLSGTLMGAAGYASILHGILEFL